MKIQIAKIPESLSEFREMTASRFRNPAEVCAWLIAALQLYVQNPEEGIEALEILHGGEQLSGYEKQFLKDRFRGKAYLAKAYFSGACPENAYEPSVPYTVELKEDKHPAEAGYRKFFVFTAGADSPRPLTLKQNRNGWMIYEYSSILSGIRLPVNQ